MTPFLQIAELTGSGHFKFAQGLSRPFPAQSVGNAIPAIKAYCQTRGPHQHILPVKACWAASRQARLNGPPQNMLTRPLGRVCQPYGLSLE